MLLREKHTVGTRAGKSEPSCSCASSVTAHSQGPPLCHLPAGVASHCSLIRLSQHELSFSIPYTCMSTPLLPPCPSLGGMDGLGMHRRNYQHAAGVPHFTSIVS